jgi:hypothetical protein
VTNALPSPAWARQTAKSIAVAKKRTTRTMPRLRRFLPGIMAIPSIFTQFSRVGPIEKKLITCKLSMLLRMLT